MDKCWFKNEHTLAFSGHCIKHDDRAPSLYAVLDLNSGRLFVRCYAGCPTDGELVEHVKTKMLEMNPGDRRVASALSLFPNKKESEHSTRPVSFKLVELDSDGVIDKFTSDRCIDRETATQFLSLAVTDDNKKYIAIRYINPIDLSSEITQLRALDNGKYRYLTVGKQKCCLVFVGGRKLIVLEGVLKALTLRSFLVKSGCTDYTIIAVQSSTVYDSDTINRYIRSRRIGSAYVIVDSDAAGSSLYDSLKRTLNCMVYRCHIDHLYGKVGMERPSASEKGKHGIDDIIAYADRHGITITIEDVMSGVKAECLSVVPMSSVSCEEPSFIYHGLIPANSIVVIEGNPGVGKSFFTVAMSLSVCTGKSVHMSNCVLSPKVIGPVLMLANEDEPGIISARCKKVGGHNLSLDNLYLSDEIIKLPDDFQMLFQSIIQLNAKLIVIDPIMNYISEKVNVYNDRDVRNMLSPMVSFARDNRCTFIIVRHKRKSTNDVDIYSGIGSIGFAGIARCVLSVERNNGNSVIKMVKGNYSFSDVEILYNIDNLSVR